jgi:hypothetical protein
VDPIVAGAAHNSIAGACYVIAAKRQPVLSTNKRDSIPNFFLFFSFFLHGGSALEVRLCVDGATTKHGLVIHEPVVIQQAVSKIA